MIKYLLGKASTGKFRFAVVECDEEWHEEDKGYIIQRSYGQVYGKTTLSPKIIVDRTKQKRNWKEQYTLQFNSEVKKFLDKGYVEVPKHPNEYAESELAEIFGDVATNQVGVIKPMLAKQESKVTKRNIFDKEWECSRKLDGVRCLMYWDGKQVRSASRGGEHYDYATEHIREKLKPYFQNSKTPMILDGELYRKGKTLQQISGAARMEKNAYDCDWLQYWIYDAYFPEHPEWDFKTRWKCYSLSIISPTYYEDADNNSHQFNEEHNNCESAIIIQVNHVTVSGEENIWKLHDQYVEEGFEGCVIRDPERPYKPNGRTNDMIKFKLYQDSEFLITGLSEGLREEDMCFTLVTEDGKEFKAKPIGSRELKEQYRQDIDQLIGKMATVKFFYYSDDGVPLQPVLKCIRDYE